MTHRFHAWFTPTYKKINAFDHIEPKINKKSATKKLLKSSKIGLA